MNAPAPHESDSPFADMAKVFHGTTDASGPWSLWMDVYEVRIGEYAKCVAAGACRRRTTRYRWGKERGMCFSTGFGDARDPMSCVDVDDATSYCTWVGKLLPTADAWELVTRCAMLADRAAPRTVTGRLDEERDDAPEHCVHDLPGNRWEWTSTSRRGSNLVRGGNPSLLAPELRFAANFSRFEPSHRSDTVGFRCALVERP
ncbi:MAG TPA: SUMF1/EgtB/PvdO family nonheme iron enzyme [Nannocystaceae bacterium]|nr:SUMF1/EgtB/PvdO family nonheme iron enzyme [Nannocystaceae bacterium]